MQKGGDYRVIGETLAGGIDVVVDRLIVTLDEPRNSLITWSKSTTWMSLRFVAA